MMAALEANQLAKSTLFIISAKHGQSPIDATRLKSGLTGFNLKNAIKDLAEPVAPIAQLTQDDTRRKQEEENSWTQRVIVPAQVRDDGADKEQCQPNCGGGTD